MNKDAAVRELLSSELHTVKVAISEGFFKRLQEAGYRRFGSVGGKDLVVSKAIEYAAAKGLIEWEGELGKRLRKPRTQKKPEAKK